jgi:predicted PurR-regulated permease PerM
LKRPTEAPAQVPLVRFEPTPKGLALTALALAMAWVALRLAPVLLVLVVALFLVGTLTPAVEWLEKKRWGRGWAIGVVFAVMLVVTLSLMAVTIPSLIAQVSSLVKQEPALRAHLADLLSHSKATAPLANSLREVHYEALAKSSAGVALDYSSRFAGLVAYLASAVFLALYTMIDRDRLRGGLFAAVPRSHHIRLSRILLNLETIVGGYIRGQALTSLFMAVFTGVLLFACGIKNALAIAIFAGLADVLPYIGTFLSIGPAVAAAASRGPVIIVVVLVAMLAYEEFESRFLVPKIYGNALRLPSSVVLFALLAGGTLMGITGALLALPAAAAALMMIKELRVELPGEAIDDGELRARDERAEEEYERRADGVPAEQAAAIAVEISEDRQQQEGGGAAAAEQPITSGERPAR